MTAEKDWHDVHGSYASTASLKNVQQASKDAPRPATISMFWHKYRSWALSAAISLGLCLLIWPTSLRTRAKEIAPQALFTNVDPPRHSTNLTDAVQWDNYTLFLEGQRVFLHSGEFHTFRLPVPDLWLDIFQKMVAAGLNGVSIYIHWGLTHPAPGVLDFNDWRALQPMYDAAKLAGIFIVLRPGPYINAETTAGGLALWATSLTSSELRTNATDFEATWKPYINAIIEATVPNQISNGGPVIAVQIDNEYSQTPIERAEYFAQLEATYLDGGIVVPLTYNDPGEGSNFINGTGAVDIYGLDSYPQGFDCSNPQVWSPVVTNYHTYHEKVNPSEPWYMPEFQGGSFDPWGGPGFDACEVLTGPDFQDVFYKQNWASNVKLISYYMIYGGTNWGGLAEPGVCTSYDYGASIRESRALSPKFDELKRQALFLRSSPDFRKTDWIGDSTTSIPGVAVNDSAAFVTFLQNPDTGAGFYIVRQANSSSTTQISFQLTVSTSEGQITLPRNVDGIALNGRQSKVVVTDYSFGKFNKLLYSTANILFAGVIGDQDVIFLYGDLDQGSEFSFGSLTVDIAPNSLGPGLTPLFTHQNSTAPLILYADTETASTFWNPVIPASGELGSYWQFGSNNTILVGGPYLVRNATVSSNGKLALRGDLNASTPLTLVLPSNINSVTWNGEAVKITNTQNVPGLFTGQLELKTHSSAIHIPTLSSWKFKDSLPEVQPGFDDSTWVIADHTTTNITKPLFGDGRVLYGCDYGFCENTVLWRGHFTATGLETSVNLTINGGTAFAASVWINNHFIATTSGGTGSEQTNAIYTFPNGSVQRGRDNVITVIQDGMGNDEDPTEKSPRGIPGFKLNNGNFTTWKVQGKLGGYTQYPDKTRGLLNEGGLFGERQGWHLPGFDTSSWTSRSLGQPLPNGPGIGFFVTTFNLNVPSGVDAMMSFVFDNVDQPYRALLFVNGWQFGKRVANIGPQFKFPVPEGILNYSGKNTVAVALWVLGETNVTPSLQLVLDGVVDGGVGPIAVNNPTWSPRSIS